jgi:lipopolysaccharide/colanic/teichoic acid biosynthesis glycosyltransferase
VTAAERDALRGPVARPRRTPDPTRSGSSPLTGWAQVHGLRGQTSLADRVEWDNWYIQSWSFGLDLEIMLMTIATFLERAE